MSYKRFETIEPAVVQLISNRLSPTRSTVGSYSLNSHLDSLTNRAKKIDLVSMIRIYKALVSELQKMT